MNIKKTVIMAIIAIIAVVAYWIDSQKRTREEAVKAVESRLVTPKKEDITELTLHRGAQTTTFVKKDDDWEIAQPIQVRADGPSVSSLVDEIDRAKRNNGFTPQNGLEAYGLKTPALTLEVKAKPNYVQDVELGGKTSGGDEIYAHLPKDASVFTVPESLFTQLTKPIKDFRYKWILQYSLDDATSAVMTFDNRTYAIAKKNDKWQMLKPVTTAGDNDKIKELLSTINRTAVNDFIDTHPLNMASFGLDKPTYTADFTSLVKGKPTLQTLLLGKDVPGKANQIYGMLKGQSFVFTIAKDEAAKMKPSTDDLRAKKLFSLEQNNIGRVSFDTMGSRLVLESDTAGKWHLAGDPKTRLDQGSVTNVVGNLLNMRASKFIDIPTSIGATGLEKPVLRLTVASKDGKTTEVVSTGKTALTGDFVYAQVENSGQLVGLPEGETKQFFVTRDQFVDKALFNFDDTMARKVQIKDGAKKLTFTYQASGSWLGQAEGATRKVSVEGSKMAALLLSVGGLNWSRHLEPGIPIEAQTIKEMKLEAPDKEILVLDEKGAELARLGQGGDKDDMTYIRRGANDYYGITKVNFNSVKSSLESVLEVSDEKK